MNEEIKENKKYRQSGKYIYKRQNLDFFPNNNIITNYTSSLSTKYLKTNITEKSLKYIHTNSNSYFNSIAPYNKNIKLNIKQDDKLLKFKNITTGILSHNSINKNQNKFIIKNNTNINIPFNKMNLNDFKKKETKTISTKMRIDKSKSFITHVKNNDGINEMKKTLNLGNMKDNKKRDLTPSILKRVKDKRNNGINMNNNFNNIKNNINNRRISTDLYNLFKLTEDSKQHNYTNKNMINNITNLHNTNKIKLPFIDNTNKINNFIKINNNLINMKNEEYFEYKREIPIELNKEEKELYGNRNMKGYVKKKLLGKGGYGIVWLCTKINNKNNINTIDDCIHEYAVKQTYKKNNLNLNIARNEVKILISLNKNNNTNNEENSDNNRNIIGFDLIPKIYNVYEDNNDIWFSFEKGGISLSNLIFKIKGEFERGERIYYIQKGKLLFELFNNIKQFKFFCKKILEGIFYINNYKKIIHSDIKPDNILIEYNYKKNIFEINSIKIIDYGSAFPYNNFNSIILTNTPEYLCPELTINQKSFRNDILNDENDKYINCIDIWSAGITFLELCLCCPIWMSYKSKIKINDKYFYTIGIFGCKCRDSNKIYQKQIEVSKNLYYILKNSMLYLFEEKDRDDFKDLLSKMLCVDYKKRINCIQALKHKFFENI